MEYVSSRLWTIIYLSLIYKSENIFRKIKGVALLSYLCEELYECGQQYRFQTLKSRHNL